MSAAHCEAQHTDLLFDLLDFLLSQSQLTLEFPSFLSRI